MKPYFEAEGVELWLGDCCEVMPGLVYDHLLADPPFSAKTHAGHNCVEGVQGRRGIDYDSWDQDDVLRYVEATRTCPGWVVTMTDHVLMPYYNAYLEAHGRYVFAPVPYVARGSRFRMYGDGPASWTLWLIMARPKEQRFLGWGSMPGSYVLPLGKGERGAWVGGKPIWLMHRLVEDYSREGDVILDSCCGSGSTLVAAAGLGRRAIGIDRSEKALKEAVRRIRGA